MSLRELSPAAKAWMVLAAGIMGWEVFCPADQLLSSAAHRLVERCPTSGRVAIICAGALLTGHLAAVIRSDMDPVSQGFWLWNLKKS